jgi:hypothetical protein
MIIIAVLFFTLELWPPVNAVPAEIEQLQASQKTQVSIETSGQNQGGSSVQDRKTVAAEYSTIDIIEKLFKIVAYVIGGLWVYFNYFKGRTYRPRLETIITGTLIKKGSSDFVNINAQIKNVGLSKVDIKQEGTALRLLIYNPSQVDDPWDHQVTIPILSAHQWIEPGEPVEEPVLLPLPSNVLAVRAEVIIVSTKTMWETAAVLT